MPPLYIDDLITPSYTHSHTHTHAHPHTPGGPRDTLRRVLWSAEEQLWAYLAEYATHCNCHTTIHPLRWRVLATDDALMNAYNGWYEEIPAKDDAWMNTCDGWHEGVAATDDAWMNPCDWWHGWMHVTDETHTYDVSHLHSAPLLLLTQVSSSPDFLAAQMPDEQLNSRASLIPSSAPSFTPPSSRSIASGTKTSLIEFYTIFQTRSLHYTIQIFLWERKER